MKNITKIDEKPKLTSKELNDLEFKITAALNRLYDQSPFYYHFLKNLPKKFDFNTDYKAYVAMDPRSKRIHLAISPYKTRNFTVADYCILLQHETLHVCLEHLKDDKYKHQSSAIKFNQACDYIINDHIPELVQRYPRIREVITKMRAEVSQMLLNGQYVTSIPSTEEDIKKAIQDMGEEKYKEVKPKLEEILDKYDAIEPFALGCTKPAIDYMPEVKNLDFKVTTSEELYYILFKEQKNGGGAEGDKGKMIIQITQGSPQDDHKPMEDANDPQHIELDELAKEEIKRAIKEAAQDALHTQKSFGNMPANLTKELFELLKSKTNYMQVIQSFATSVRDSDSQRTWVRQHRKYPNQTPGRKREYKPTLTLVLDTSGSMFSDKLMQIMASEIKALKEVCQNLYLVMGDTCKTDLIDLCEKDFDIANFKFKGGGGTDLQFGFDEAKLLKSDGVLVHSDGFVPEWNDYGIKTMVLVYPGGQEVKPEKYQNIKVDDC